MGATYFTVILVKRGRKTGDRSSRYNAVIFKGEGVSKTTNNATVPATDARQLLERVVTSPSFQKSKRLRDLLQYLGERGLDDPNCTLREQEIGADVLGRPPDYDTSHDTLVRVLVSQLRKKLQEHFAEEGRNEPLLIDIPKGSYVPVFRPRPEGEAPRTEILTPQPVATRHGIRTGIAIGIGLMALVWGSFALVRPALERRAGGRPAVEALWVQLFGNGQPTYLVLSDVTLIEFEKQIGRPVPLSEYEAHEFDRLAALYIPNEVQRGLAREFVNRVTTSVSDVQVARDFGVLAASKRLPLSVISARDLSSTLALSQNIILLGSRRANPWVGLFEDQMAFPTDYQETPPSVRFINRSPLPGEPAAFQAEWRRYGYCRVTCLPNPNRTRNVLLISGSDVISSEAGGRFLATEDSVRLLRQKLGLKPGEPVPPFEALLRTQVVNNTIPWFELVAFRSHRASR